jgi:hypothetical protein
VMLASPQGCEFEGCEWWVEEKGMCSIRYLAERMLPQKLTYVQ